MNKKISVILPTYRPQDYLWKCLDSLDKQTIPKNYYDVLIVLNGCKEPYLSQINEYILEHKINNFLCIQIDEGGVSNARNIGLDKASGEYITFIDDDDYVSPKYLEELLSLSNLTTIALSYELAFDDGTNIFYPYYITKEYDNYHNKGVMPFYKPRRLFNGPVYKLIHREIIGNRRFNTNFKNAEDALFMILLSDRFKDVVFTTKEAVYYRRVRSGSASMGGRKSFLYRFNNGLRLILESYRVYFSNSKDYNFRFISRQVIGFVRDIFLH